MVLAVSSANIYYNQEKPLLHVWRSVLKEITPLQVHLRVPFWGINWNLQASNMLEFQTIVNRL